MARRFGTWLASVVCVCLVTGGCAESALQTPGGSSPNAVAGSTGSTGSPGSDGSSDGAGSPGPAGSAAESPQVGVVDESAGRSADGLPKVVDGRPVLRGDDAVSHAASTTDATPFLLGGWVTPATPGPGAPACIPGCGDQTKFADRAGTIDAALDKQIDLRLLSTVSTLVGGPLVIQVHTHDPGPDCSGSGCDAVMIADQVLWTGDAQTEPRPLGVDAATSIITATFSGTAFEAIGSPIVDCGHQLPASQLLIAVPPPDESGASAPRDWIASVNIAPSIDALTAALKTVAQPKTPAPRPGVQNVFTKANLVCRASVNGPARTYRWFIADNVAVLTATADDPSLPDRVFAQQLGTAFTAAAPSESPAASQSASPPASVSAPDQGTFPTPKPTRRRRPRSTGRH